MKRTVLSLYLSLIALAIALPAYAAAPQPGTTGAKSDQQALVSTVVAPTSAPTVIAAAKADKTQAADKAKPKAKKAKAKAGTKKAKPKAKAKKVRANPLIRVRPNIEA